jgi:hypothetical protein
VSIIGRFVRNQEGRCHEKNNPCRTVQHYSGIPFIGVPCPGDEAGESCTYTYTNAALKINAYANPPRKINASRTPLPSLLSILPGQMDFGFGGGSGYGTFGCSDFLRNYRGAYPVAFIGERFSHVRAEASLCIAGFPMNGPLRIKLATTGGKIIGSAVFESDKPIKGRSDVGIHQTSPVADDYAGLSGFDKNNLPLILIDVWLPPDFPYTQLRIDASNNAGNFAGIINEITLGGDDDTPYLYVSSTIINPFDFPYESVGYSIRPGQQLIIKGINFAKNTFLPVAVYHSIYGARDQELQSSNWIQSDSQGRVSVSLRFNASYPPSYYTLAVFSDPPDIDPGEFIGGIFVDTCPGAPSSRLSVGSLVIINPESPQSNNIRSQPGLKGSVVGTLNGPRHCDRWLALC